MLILPHHYTYQNHHALPFFVSLSSTSKSISSVLLFTLSTVGCSLAARFGPLEFTLSASAVNLASFCAVNTLGRSEDGATFVGEIAGEKWIVRCGSFVVELNGVCVVLGVDILDSGKNCSLGSRACVV